MGPINRAGISNAPGDIIQAVMTKVIPAHNDLEERVSKLERRLGLSPTPAPPKPAPAVEEPVASAEETVAPKKATSRKK